MFKHILRSLDFKNQEVFCRKKFSSVVYACNDQVKMEVKWKPREVMTIKATFSLRTFAAFGNFKF